MRAVERELAEENKAAMIACLEEGAASVGAQLEQEWELEYDGFLYGEDEPAVQLIKRAAESCGLPFKAEYLCLDTPDVSSTQLREHAGRGEPLDGLVPAGVADYIYAHGLYGAAPRAL